MLSLPPPDVLFAIVIVIFFGIGLHEYAHCKFADLAGDPTPRYYGRVTLNLTKHFEPMGTLMMLLSSISGYGLGWGRPAPMNPSKMHNPRWDTFVATAAGPVSNLMQATLYGFLLRLFLSMGVIDLQDILLALDRQSGSFLAAVLTYGVLLNLGLFTFNLLPIGPLDGHWLVGLLLPEPYQTRWFQFSRRYGFMILIGVILFSQITRFPILFRAMEPVIAGLFQLITGLTE